MLSHFTVKHNWLLTNLLIFWLSFYKMFMFLGKAHMACPKNYFCLYKEYKHPHHSFTAESVTQQQFSARTESDSVQDNHLQFDGRNCQENRTKHYNM